MKWFRHDSNSNMDAKLQEVLLDYGLEGYGLYWYCIELIATNVDQNNLTFQLEHDARIIARNTGSTVQKVEEMMKRFIDVGLFEASEGVITCLKLAKRTDEYTQKVLRNSKSVGRVSGQNPKKSLLIKENTIEEKNKEEKNVNPFKKWTDTDFWNSILDSSEGKDYSIKMQEAFYIYWIEQDTKGKMKFQLNKTWQTSSRFATWFRNNF